MSPSKPIQKKMCHVKGQNKCVTTKNKETRFLLQSFGPPLQTFWFRKNKQHLSNIFGIF